SQALRNKSIFTGRYDHEKKMKFFEPLKILFEYMKKKNFIKVVDLREFDGEQMDQNETSSKNEQSVKIDIKERTEEYIKEGKDPIQAAYLERNEKIEQVFFEK